MVHFKTSDGWTIEAEYHPAKRGRGTVVLVHGVGAGHGEWQDLEPALWKLGLGTLAIDLRGHGGSTNGPKGRRTFESFGPGDWAGAQADLAAAQRYLVARGVAKKKIGLMGGSIGANLAGRQAADSGAPWAALLSPGMDYRGVALEIPESPTCVAASGGDPYALQTSLALVERPNVTFLQAEAGHGAQMLKDPAFVAKLLAWIEKVSAKR